MIPTTYHVSVGSVQEQSQENNMTQEDLIKLEFNKVSISEDDHTGFCFEKQYGGVVFISGNNDEAAEDGTWYVTTPCQSFKFYAYNDMKSVIDLFNRNKIY